MGLFRKKQVNTDISLSDGIVMKQPLQMETSSWLKNCMVKSLLVFSVAFGAIGCFLSAFELEYYVLPTAFILFAMALLFTTIYYRGWLMDAVYVVFLFIFFLLVRSFQPYINGGYYLIINRVFETIESYFDLPGMQYYEISVENEILAVSVIVIFIGTVMMILGNVIISRTMNIWILLYMTSFLWIAPMYFRLEPDSLYVILMVTGYLTVWSIHSSGAYGMDRKHRDYKWKNKKGKPLRFRYVQDAATMLQSMGLLVVSVLILYGITSVIGGKDTFNIRYRQNPQKEESERIIQEISTRGFSVFDRYASTGGMSGGKLGGVGWVRPDYQTDLIVRYTPYSLEPVYLKGFVGIDYVSDQSQWITYEENPQNPYYQGVHGEGELSAGLYTYSGCYEVTLLDKAYRTPGIYAGIGRMQIKNVGANENYPYIPYYTASDVSYSAAHIFYGNFATRPSGVSYYNGTLEYSAGSIVTGRIPRDEWAEYIYYPLINRQQWPEAVAEMSSDTDIVLEIESDEDGVIYRIPSSQAEQADAIYLTVPEECYEAVARASEEAGITEADSREEIIQKVKDYFETEFLYTTRPGRTPRDQDFVSWFLKEKKGYCAHFATAATMIYRYNGIPARYIEGYVITYEDIMNSELSENRLYKDYYRGDSLLGETAVVDVEVTDARAHAWVEILDPNLGWRSEEVTTAAIDPEEELESFWDVFGDGIRQDENVADVDFNLNTLDWDLDDIQGIWIGLLVVLAVLLLLYAGRNGYYRWQEYQSWHTEDMNENVLAYYHLISKRLRRKDPVYAQCPTYRRQLHYMESRSEEWNWNADRLAKLLEKACYSQSGISESDCSQLMLELTEIHKKTKKWKASRKK